MKQNAPNKGKSIKDIFFRTRIKWNIIFRRNHLIVEYAPSCIFMSKVEGEANRMEEKERLERIHRREIMFQEITRDKRKR